MGAVWEGTHATLGTRVAVKFIDPEYADSPDARNRFENEARAAASLRSKHVVEMYDHGLSEDGSPFIVMEYLEGEPLDQRLDREGRLSPAETARILLQACRAVARAHSAGIVHRDLKPENLFLVWDDEEQTDFVKVLDFGIAKFTDRSVNASSATRTGSVLGTPFYMSPEQARGLRSVDHRTDVWSLGVIAYRCIVGSLPFDGEAIGDLLVRLCTEPIPVPSQMVPDVPAGFDAFILRALSRDLTQRFQTVQEFADSLARTCGVASRSMLASADPSNPTPELPRVRQRLSGAGSKKSSAHSHGDETGGALTQSTDPTQARRSQDSGAGRALDCGADRARHRRWNRGQDAGGTRRSAGAGGQDARASRGRARAATRSAEPGEPDLERGVARACGARAARERQPRRFATDRSAASCAAPRAPGFERVRGTAAKTGQAADRSRVTDVPLAEAGNRWCGVASAGLRKSEWR